ncbi:MAG: tail fiber protein [Kiritimatiellae bacterium]|nr:tail fiber protein [Kiritimatiellia bacterium]
MAVSGDATFSTSATVSGDATVEGDLTVSGTVSGYGSVPVGTIVLWSGAANKIPDGWALCDGSTVNGSKTPDLRGRFVVGYNPNDGDYSVKKTGGEKYHQLSVEELPSHSHNISLSIWGYTGSRKDLWEVAAPEWYYSNKQTISSQSVGGNQAHENRPPYYTLCYIMRVK